MSTSSHPTEVAHSGLAWQLLQTMPEAVFLVDLESLAILATNPLAERLASQRRDALLTRSLRDVLIPNDGRDLSILFEEASGPLSDRTPLSVHFQTTPTEAEAFTASAQVLASDGQLRGLVTVHSSPVSDETSLRGRIAQKDVHIRRLFDESSTAQFELDWSEIRKRLQDIRDSGVPDLRSWFDEFPIELENLSRKARITAVNRRTLEMYEAESVSEFAGTLASILKQDSLAAFKEHVLFRASGGKIFETENVAYTMSGKRLHIHVRATTAFDAEDSWSRILASVTDITRSKNAEALRDGQRRVLESLAAVNSVETVLQTLSQELERQSPRLRAAVFGTSSTGNRLQRIANGNTAEELVTLLDSVVVGNLYGSSTKRTEIRFSPIDRKDDSAAHERILPAVSELISRTVRACGYQSGILEPATNAAGELLGILAVFRTDSAEFTEHEKEAIASFTNLTELVLQHDEHRRALTVRTDELQSIFNSYPDALLRLSSDGTIVESYSGNELTEFLRLSTMPDGQILWHLLPPRAAGSIRTAIDSVAAGSRQETIHFSVLRDADHRDFELRLVPLPSTTEQIAVLRDVTQLKHAELKLSHANEQFRYLFDNSPDAIFVETPDGVVQDANEAACELHKLSREDLIGQNVLSLVPPDDRPDVSDRSGAMLTGEISEFESRSLQSDGQVVHVGVRISTITYDGQPAVLLHVRDITQQKIEAERKREQERQLAHVSRLTIMGQLVAGIAHEIRQPLWSLSTFADVCAESLSRPDFVDRISKIRDVAGKIVSEARRVNTITTRMFSFARNGTAERTTCNIGDLATDAIELMAGRARSSRIRTTLHVAPGIPSVLCDRILIEQTIANLLNNAYTALAAHPSDSREVTVEVIQDDEDSDYLSVFVRDNGPGLPEGVVPEQLFEGFFTTGQSGLGIGLALSRSFVEDHGGMIRAEQLPDGGMEFVFTLRIDGGNQADAD